MTWSNLIMICMIGSAQAQQTLVPQKGGGWVTRGLPYECRIGADGKLQSLTVGDFEYVGNRDGMFLIDRKELVPFTDAKVVKDELRISANGAAIRIRFLPEGPSITVANHSLRHGSVFRLRLSEKIARIKPLGRSGEPAMPLKSHVSGALRFIGANGSSLTFGRSESYHLGASCNARPDKDTIVVQMPWIMPELTTTFPLVISATPLLEDAVRLETTTDHPDNTFWDNKPFDFHVTAKNMDPEQKLKGAIVLKLRNYLTGEIVREERKPLKLAAGASRELTWTIKDLDPMLYMADLWIEKGGKQGFCSSPRFVFNASKILPPEVPDDFDAFWARTLKEQAAIPLDLKLTMVREEETRTVYKFSFAGLLDYRCHGWLTVPKDRSKKWPGVLVLPPAGMRSQPVPRFTDVVGMAININTGGTASTPSAVGV